MREGKDGATIMNRKLTQGELTTALGEMPPILTAEEAADLLRLKVSTVYRYVSEGKYGGAVKRGKPLRFCREAKLCLARRFSETDLYRYREWLVGRQYADKTVQGALVLAKQLFKWAWRQGTLRDYRLAAATFQKAKARPQPCFTSKQVDQLIKAAAGEEKAAFALMGYAGLRIGEVEQLQWQDIQARDGNPTMLHIRRGGSNGSTKDKDERFVPIHPKVAEQFGSPRSDRGPIYCEITQRTLLKRLKALCKRCEFENPQQYKLPSFRHHVASLCANNRVAHRKALAWLGHGSLLPPARRRQFAGNAGPRR